MYTSSLLQLAKLQNGVIAEKDQFSTDAFYKQMYTNERAGMWILKKCKSCKTWTVTVRKAVC